MFLDKLVQCSAGRRSGGERRVRDFYIKEALTFIEQNYQRDISIEEIAAVSGLNRSYFGKVFRDAVGESPQAYLLHYRMARAAQLLKETRLSIGEIAAQVSYELRQSAALLAGLQERPWRLPPGVPLHPPDRSGQAGQNITAGPMIRGQM